MDYNDIHNLGRGWTPEEAARYRVLDSEAQWALFLKRIPIFIAILAGVLAIAFLAPMIFR